MFAIMGATGQTGGAALAEIQRRGARVRAITRDPALAQGLKGEGVEIVRAEATDPESLAEAFSGADAVYVLNPAPLDVGDVRAEAAAMSAAVAQAVRQAAVRHVVALSSQGAHLTEGTGIIRTLNDFEAALRGTGASNTFIRATYFMESWATGLDVARDQGILPSLRRPVDAAFETVSAADVGRVAADCLLDPRNAERIVNLVGPEDYSPRDAAAVMTELFGKRVEAIEPPRESWISALTASGLGTSYAAELASMYDGLNASRIAFEPGVGELRRGSVTLGEALRATRPPARRRPAKRLFLT